MPSRQSGRDFIRKGEPNSREFVPAHDNEAESGATRSVVEISPKPKPHQGVMKKSRAGRALKMS